MFVGLPLKPVRIVQADIILHFKGDGKLERLSLDTMVNLATASELVLEMKFAVAA